MSARLDVKKIHATLARDLYEIQRIADSMVVLDEMNLADAEDEDGVSVSRLALTNIRQRLMRLHAQLGVLRDERRGDRSLSHLLRPAERPIQVRE